MRALEALFERVLWGSRYLVLIAVVGGLIAACALLAIGAYDVFIVIDHTLHYMHPGIEAAARRELHDGVVTEVIKIVDGFLLSTAVLIFSLGLYELFVSDIDIAKGSHMSSKILLISSLDDLKSRLAKVILIILIVTLFENTLKVKIEEPLHLAYVGAAIALIGLALYLAHASDAPGHDGGETRADAHDRPRERG